MTEDDFEELVNDVPLVPPAAETECGTNDKNDTKSGGKIIKNLLLQNLNLHPNLTYWDVR